MELHQASSEESLVSPLSIADNGKSAKHNNNTNGIDSLQRTLALMQILTLGYVHVHVVPLYTKSCTDNNSW